MPEHIDKGKIIIPGDLVSDADRAHIREVTEAQRVKEAAQLNEAEQKREIKYNRDREELIRQYDEFVKNTTNLDKVQAMGFEWFNPGHIVEMFVADFSPLMKLEVSKALTQKATPYGKILSSSPLNDQAQRFEPGTIIHVSDAMAHVRENPEWLEWSAANRTNQRFAGPEPPRFVKKIYGWIIEGKLFYPDKARLVLDREYAVVSAKGLEDFPGPYIFELDTYEVGRKAIKGNPWA